MPRVLRPVVLHPADVLAVDALAANVAAVACMRSTSLAAAGLLLLPAPSQTRLSLLLSPAAAPLSPAEAPPLLHHWHMLPGTILCSARTRMRGINKYGAWRGVARNQERPQPPLPSC